MRIQKTSTLNDPTNTTSQDTARQVDTDLTNVFQAINGKIRFGDGTTGMNGENISGQWVTFLSSGTNGATTAVSHTIGAVPVGYIVTSINKPAMIYTSGTSTAWSGNTVYLVSSTTNLKATIFLLR